MNFLKKYSWAFVCFWVGVSWVKGAEALPFNINKDDTIKSVVEKLGKDEVTQFSSLSRQGYSKGIIYSELLWIINTLKVENYFFPEGREIPEAYFVEAKKQDMEVTAAFIKKKIRYLLIRSQVKPDTSIGGKNNVSEPERLLPLRKKLRELSKNCRIKKLKKDKWGNTFTHKGKCENQAALYIHYVPENDRIYGLYVFR